MFSSKTEVYWITGKARIEGTQRGYVVWVATDKRAKAQISDATTDYSAAYSCAMSIDRGHYTGRRKNAVIHVRGKKLTTTVTQLVR